MRPKSILPTGYFDLAVMALSFHHLPPAQAAQVIAEGTRVADKLMIIDLPRSPSLLHIVKLATFVPFLAIPFAHDGFISSMRAYSSILAHRGVAIAQTFAALTPRRLSSLGLERAHAVLFDGHSL